MAPDERPVGVTLLAIFGFVSAAILVVLGLNFGSLKSEKMSGDWAGLSDLGEFETILCFGFALLLFPPSAGLIKMKNWARWTVIIEASLCLILLSAWIGMTGVPSDALSFWVLTPACIALLILLYFFLPGVKRAFGAKL